MAEQSEQYGNAYQNFDLLHFHKFVFQVKNSLN